MSALLASDLAARRDATLTRIVDQAVLVDGLLVWPRDSVYHWLLTDDRIEVDRRARRNAEALAEHAP